MNSSEPGDFKRGDKVTVIHAHSRFDEAIGKTGTVGSVSEAGDLVCVLGLTPKIKGAIEGRTFFWHQLIKAERPNSSGGR